MLAGDGEPALVVDVGVGGGFGAVADFAVTAAEAGAADDYVQGLTHRFARRYVSRTNGSRGGPQSCADTEGGSLRR